MYFWTIHPEYLDNKGLIDLWRRLQSLGNLQEKDGRPVGDYTLRPLPG